MVDMQQQIRLTALCNLLQEVAGNHANFLGMGYEGMKARGQFWALSRLRLAMDTFPKWLETIEIHSWVSSIKGPFSHRNFLLLAEDGSELGSASTLWALLSAESRRPSRIQDHSFTLRDDKLPACGLPAKLPVLSEASVFGTHAVVYSDLDMIGHVNNGKYVEWITDSFSEDRSVWQPVGLTINYLQETLAGESVEICGLTEKMDYRYELKKVGRGVAVCRALIEWKTM